MSPIRVQQTVFLQFNKHVPPDLNKVLVSLHGLKEERKVIADVPVAPKTSVSGDGSVLGFSFPFPSWCPIPIPILNNKCGNSRKHDHIFPRDDCIATCILAKYKNTVFFSPTSPTETIAFQSSILENKVGLLQGLLLPKKRRKPCVRLTSSRHCQSAFRKQMRGFLWSMCTRGSKCNSSCTRFHVKPKYRGWELPLGSFECLLYSYISFIFCF